MIIDCSIKRDRFIGKVNSLLQKFHYVDYQVIVKILNIFTTSFYGSGLWDLQSSEWERLYKSLNVAVRQALRLPYTSHRYLIEPLSNCIHPKTMLSSRLVKFNSTLKLSSKPSVKLLSLLCQGIIGQYWVRT